MGPTLDLGERQVEKMHAAAEAFNEVGVGGQGGQGSSGSRMKVEAGGKDVGDMGVRDQGARRRRLVHWLPWREAGRKLHQVAPAHWATAAQLTALRSTACHP